MATVNKQAMEKFKADLNSLKPTLRLIAPRHKDIEKMCRLALSCVKQNPTLLECSADSLIRSVALSVRLGLECDGALGSAYIVPFNRKNKKTGRFWKEATLIPGYRGLIDLARRSGAVNNIWACVVHANDQFSIRLGTDPHITHIPTFVGDPGEVIGFYACAVVQPRDYNGNPAGEPFVQFEFMTKMEIERIRSMSKSGNSGPWVDYYEQMGRKTPIRRLCTQSLPMSAELASAVLLQASAEDGVARSAEAVDILADENLSEMFVDVEYEDMTETEPEPAQQKKSSKAARELPPAQKRETVEVSKTPEPEKVAVRSAFEVDNDPFAGIPIDDTF